ncbi:putative reverse transcriptase domain-containing protein [Tanacetum coccineum]
MKTIKVDDQKLKDIPVVRKFPGVFPEDLSGLPPSREVEFRIDLILGAMLVAKSPYRLALTKMQELSNQLKISKTKVSYDIVLHLGELLYDILIYSKSKEEHEVHLQLILELLEKEKLFGNSRNAIFANFSKIATPLTLLTQKDKKFEWGDKQENAFQTQKDMLCYASILALLEGLDDFVIRYQSGKADVVADALSKKEWMKPRRARGMCMTIHSSIKARIMEAQSEASKDINTSVEMLRGLEKQFERKEDIDLYFVEQIRTDGQSERTIQTLEDMRRACAINFGGNWGTHLPLAEFSYNNSYHLSVKCTPFETLYGRKCQMPIALAEVGESKLMGREIFQETIDKIVQIKERLKTVKYRQKSYVNNWLKPLEFSVGDKVLLKVSPWKGVVRFGKRSKFPPRYVGPFEIVGRVSLVAYRLRLPQELVGIHDTFHVSNLKKCPTDINLYVPLEEIKIVNGLHFLEELIEIIDREVKKLKQCRIPIMKVRWNSRRGPEFTWE